MRNEKGATNEPRAASGEEQMAATKKSKLHGTKTNPTGLNNKLQEPRI